MAGALSPVIISMIMVPVYVVHKEDPDAYIVWFKSLIAPRRRSSWIIKDRPIHVVEKTRSGLKVTSFSHSFKR